MLGRKKKNCFQAQLSIDRLCAPPILSPLFDAEFIFFFSEVIPENSIETEMDPFLMPYANKSLS